MASTIRVVVAAAVASTKGRSRRATRRRRHLGLICIIKGQVPGIIKMTPTANQHPAYLLLAHLVSHDEGAGSLVGV